MVNKFLYIGLLSLISAAFTLLMPNALWLVAIYMICFLVMYQKSASLEDGKVVFKIITAACVVRSIMILLYGSICQLKKVPDMIGDASAFTYCGLYMTEVLTRTRMYFSTILDLMWNGYAGLIPQIDQMGGLTYLQTILYSAFGYSVFTIKLLNSLVSILSGFVMYHFLRKRLGSYVSILTMIVILFWPTMLIWSVTGLKEPFIIFISLIILIIFTKLLSEEFRLKKFIFSAISIIALIIFADTLRHRIGYIYWETFGLSLCAIWLIKAGRKARNRAILGIVFAVYLLSQTATFRTGVDLQLRRMVAYQVAQASEHAKTYYKIYPDRIYSVDPLALAATMRSEPLSLTEWSFAALKGMAYFGFSPFFYDIKVSKSLIFAYPQALAILALFPFMISGAVKMLREQPNSFVPLFTFMILYWVTAAMISGNIGSALRHRDIMMPAYLLFSVIGVCKFFGRRA